MYKAKPNISKVYIDEYLFLWVKKNFLKSSKAKIIKENAKIF